MELSRIKAVFIRHIILLLPRDVYRHLDLLYWPLLDIILWGITAQWVQKGCSADVNVPMLVLTGLVLWHVVYRAHIEVVYSLLDELWSHNMVNLFSSPLTFSEWLVAMIASSMAKVFFLFCYGVLLVYFLYDINILVLGWPLVLFVASLIVSGWAIGFFTTGLLIFFGQKIQTLAWVMGYFFAPFSAVYYPIESLPYWARMVSYGLPMTYFFETMRELVLIKKLNIQYLSIGTVLNIFYLIASVAFFKVMFKRTKVYGLARLERFE